MRRRWLGALGGRLSRPATSHSVDQIVNLLKRHERTGELAVLTEAVTLGREAVLANPTGHPSRAAILNNLGIALRRLFEQTGEIAVLTEAVTVGREAVVATSTDHPHRAMHLSNLGVALSRLFERTGELAILTEAVTLGRQAVGASPTDHPDRAATLNNLAVALRLLFERTGELAVLTEAVTVRREAAGAVPTGHPHRAIHMNNLGLALSLLFERTGEPAVLTEAVTVGREAVGATAVGHPHRAGYLNNLGGALRRLFERTGELAVLTEAVTIRREAVEETPADHPIRAGRLSNLAAALSLLFEQTGELTVLTEAIIVGRQAVGASPTDHPHRVMHLNNLAITLRQLFERTGDLAVLNEAVTVRREVMAATPTDHAYRAGRLNNLGISLQFLFEQTGELAVLTEAEAVGRHAVAATPTDHPHRAGMLNNLGITLRWLFERTGELAVLTEAVTVGRQAVAAAPTDHPDRAMHLINLGLALQLLFERTGELAVLTEVQEIFADAAALPVAGVWVRIIASRRLGDAYMSAGQPQAALAALEAVVELVPQLAPRALARPDREYGLSRLAGLGAEVAAAATAAGQPERAIELLEQTRGVLLAEAIDARSDLTELRRATPDLAARFDDLREQITALDDAAPGYAPLAEPSPTGKADPCGETHRQLGAHRQRLAQQWTELLDRIRATPGFGQFLLPPPINHLRRQADEGPLVAVYASRWRADALIITSDPARPVQVLPLPGLTDTTADEQATRLLAACAAADGDASAGVQAQDQVHAVLRWLWDAIAGPVLTHLGFTGEAGHLPRIWWCPIGVCVALPLHAAGHHTTTPNASVPATVMDRVTSSYIPTIRALEYARADRGTPRTPAGSALIVAMPTTPDAPDLPAVAAEADQLAHMLGSALTLIGPAAHYQAVTAALPRYRIAHFACHGLSNRTDPAASQLLLHDHDRQPLTVTALSRLHLADAELAFLSACSTTQTSAALADEAVHITAACHLAGYRRVVGTLWSINDAAAARIATQVYTSLTGGGTHPPRIEDSARALAEAIRQLRDDFRAVPTYWAAHIHLGA